MRQGRLRRRAQKGSSVERAVSRAIVPRAFTAPTAAIAARTTAAESAPRRRRRARRSINRYAAATTRPTVTRARQQPPVSASPSPENVRPESSLRWRAVGDPLPDCLDVVRRNAVNTFGTLDRHPRDAFDANLAIGDLVAAARS